MSLPNAIIATVEICHLYISYGHNFVGHHGREADAHPMIEVTEIMCAAGRGIRGDRYFDFKADYKGQITFFSLDVFDELCATLNIHDCSPAAARRNVIMRGIDLNDFIGTEFEVQGVRLFGMEESAPCYWMDQAIAPGARDFLKGRGGLRAKILCDGLLRSTALVCEH
ncbi:MAG: molybdenum cofactor biosysynthesis protein [Alphaproteobacteria bacterium]